MLIADQLLLNRVNSLAGVVGLTGNSKCWLGPLKTRLSVEDYNPEQDHINQLTRQGQTTIFRLKTGHCGLRKHMKKMGLVDTASCQCGAEEETPDHILQTCPHLEQLRREIWPIDTSLHNKLWGNSDDLQKTEQFIAMSGLRI
nr:hypothetical protein BaRGS_008028 [Batillaria attramentaria]